MVQDAPILDDVFFQEAGVLVRVVTVPRHDVPELTPDKSNSPFWSLNIGVPKVR